MQSVFIMGNSTAGKSTLADRLAASFGMTCVKTDDLRAEMENDPALEPWVNFYWNKDEEEYFRITSPDAQWQDLVNQSEAFWPHIKKHIESVLALGKPAVFEGVTLLPHLMRELQLEGVVLLSKSEEEIVERLHAGPRWGAMEELQRMEAHALFAVERPQYDAEAKKFGYATFDDMNAAEAELERLIQGK